MIKELTTRELLRNFKKYKKEISEGAIESILIKMHEGDDLIMSLNKKNGNGQKILDCLRKMPNPIKINRKPELFEEFIRL